MLSYSKISMKPALFRSFTGLAVEEFNTLYGPIENKYSESEQKRLGREDRHRAIGGGRRFSLPLKERLLMLLVYYRLYVTYALAGFLFNLDQSNVCRDIRYIEPLAKRCVPLPEKVHKRTKKIRTMEDLLKHFPDMKAFVDATEQEIPRPSRRRKRESHYSGKKKRHTVKTQIMANKKGLVIHMSRHFRGRGHDYDIYKKCHPSVPPDVELNGDLGYEGIKNDFPYVKSRIPRKKPREGELSAEDREYNRALSKNRVVVEHAIARMKKFGIMGGKFRNRLARYDSMTAIVSGLANFRVMLKDGLDVKEFVG